MTNLTDNEIFSIRQTMGPSDADLSRACSTALWGDTHQARTGARRRVARMVADADLIDICQSALQARRNGTYDAGDVTAASACAEAINDGRLNGQWCSAVRS